MTSLGFVKQSFDAIANAIEQSIIQAHNNLKPGSIFINTGKLFPVLSLQMNQPLYLTTITSILLFFVNNTLIS